MKLLNYMAFLLTFAFASYVYAQDFESYTNPSDRDLELIEDAVARCDILAEVLESIDGSEKSSQEIFDKLQQTDENGNLLIDRPECEDAILDFVSSMCTSDESINNVYCKKLGITKIADTSNANTSSDFNKRGNYKNFGASVLDDLDLHNHQDRAYFATGGAESQSKETIFGIDQALFLLAPVRGLKLAKPSLRVAKAVGSRIKPVLSGAMLMLASLGLASCDDLTGPEQVCNSGLSNYVLLRKTPTTGTNSGAMEEQLGCIKLPDVDIVYTDGDGNIISGTSQASKEDLHIHIQFDSLISYVDENGRGSKLAKNINLYDMIQIQPQSFSELVGQYILLDDFEVGSKDGKSYITIKPPTLLNGFYPEGNHSITVKNYAKQKDLSLIASSDNKDEYLSLAKAESVFYIGESITPCSEGLPGYFQLESEGNKLKCIILPQVAFNYTSSGVTTSQADGSNDVVIDIVFDSKVVYLGQNNTGGGFFSWEELSLHRLMQMVSVRQDGRELVGRELGIDNLSFSLTAGGNTYIRIMPPENGWAESDYEVSIENYAKKDDANLIVNSDGAGENSRTRYLAETKKYSLFHVGELENNCTIGRLGYFQLYDEGDSLGKCIQIPDPVITYSNFGGADNIITIEFDSEIAYIDQTGWQEMVVSRLFDMLEIIPADIGDSGNNGANLVGNTIGLEQLRVVFRNGRHSIIIAPPVNGYSEGSYRIGLKNYTRVEDAGFIFKSQNTADYVNGVSVATYFYVGTQITPCTLGQPGYFQLIDGERNRIQCVKLPEVEFRYTSLSGQSPATGARDVVIDIVFDSKVAFIGQSGGGFYTWEELSLHRILQMVSVKQGGTELVGDEIGIAQLSFGLTSGGNSYIRIMPPANGYGEGDYEVSVENYAKLDDVGLIYYVTGTANDIARYLAGTTKYSVFYVGDPESPCDRNETGYFELELDSSRSICIKLPEVGVSYSSSSGADDVVITINFDTRIAHIDDNNWLALEKHHVLDMVEIAPINGGGNLVGDTIGLEQVNIRNNGSRITISPPVNGYSNGDYIVSVKDYAKYSDASLVSASSNKGDYLARATRTSAFYVGTRNTPCARGEQGYFQLVRDGQDIECIKLANVDISYSSSSGADNVVITIDFGTRVAYIDEDSWAGLEARHVLDMVEVTRISGGENLIGNTIGLEQISIRNGSRVTISPPVIGYPDGDYTVSVTGYVKDSDAELVLNSDNTGEYLGKATKDSAFYVGTRDTPCTRGEKGYFQLEDEDGQDTECVKLANVDISYSSSSGADDGVITIDFDTAVAFIGSQGDGQSITWAELKKHHVLDMVEVNLRDGGNLIGGVGESAIGLEQISVGVVSGRHRITINPPYDRYTEGVYDVVVSNYAKEDDVYAIFSSGNTEDYLAQTDRQSSFYVGEGKTPCSRGEAGWFQLKKGDNNIRCIKRPVATFSYTTPSGTPIVKAPGRVITIPNDAILTITFDGEVSYIGEIGGGGVWEPLSAKRVFDMVDIRALEGCNEDNDYGDCEYSGTNEIGTTIRLDKILVGKTGGNSFIRIDAPERGYSGIAEIEEEVCITDRGEQTCETVTRRVPTSDYRIELENYIYTADAEYTAQEADNLTGAEDGFLAYTITYELFHLEDPPVDECEAGLFGLDLGVYGKRCIELPEVDISYSSSDDSNDVVITIDFDTNIAYIGENNWEALEKHHVLGMVEVKPRDSDDNLIGQTIGLDQISVSSRRITINPPLQRYVEGVYDVVVNNYGKEDDASLIFSSENRDEYLDQTNRQSVFYVGEGECNAGAGGYFTLRNAGARVGCIEMPTAEISFMEGSDNETIGKEHGIYTVPLGHVIEITFDGLIAKMDSSSPASELTYEDISDIVDIRKLTCTTDVPNNACEESTSNVLESYYRYDQDRDRSETPHKSLITLNPRSGSSFSDGEFYKITLKNFYYEKDYDHLSDIIGNVDNIEGSGGYLESLNNHIEYYRTPTP